MIYVKIKHISLKGIFLEKIFLRSYLLIIYFYARSKLYKQSSNTINLYTQQYILSFSNDHRKLETNYHCTYADIQFPVFFDMSHTCFHKNTRCQPEAQHICILKFIRLIQMILTVYLLYISQLIQQIFYSEIHQKQSLI